ncbi:hypothetical protein B0J13DRAFT_292688 [Dactylonectria estremocensis]|uniref:Uncharacterized protein n=1 Tax=Dactylonectria estremocensis TaxID=1079267 RepID=A0A9P9I7U0_9HYPO|nr:hypothetical protein B0J13DRAFT_292688 [Dactylonectria estremocensis]
MKLSFFASVLVLGLPFTDAWGLKLYDKERYKVKIHDRDGTLSQPCKNLGKNVNKAQSMQWDHRNLATNCRLRLYDSGDCSGKPLADSNYASWNLPAFSSKAKNKVNSYKINCRAN